MKLNDVQDRSFEIGAILSQMRRGFEQFQLKFGHYICQFLAIFERGSFFNWLERTA